MRILGWEMIGNRLIVELRHKVLVAHCTACGTTSSRKHGCYRRRVKDLPCSGHRITLEIHVRRFRCDNTRCRRRTFAECLPQFVARQQRRTARAQTVLWHVGLALSGSAGARLAQRLGIAISGDRFFVCLSAMARSTSSRHRGPASLASMTGHSSAVIATELYWSTSSNGDHWISYLIVMRHRWRIG